MNPDRAMLDAWTRDDDAMFDANPVAKRLGMRIVEIDRVNGRIVLGFDEGGPRDTTALAAMLDFGLCFAALCTLPATTTVATATLHVEQVAAAGAGELRVDARVDARGARTFNVGATLLQDATPVALGRSVLGVIAEPG